MDVLNELVSRLPEFKRMYTIGSYPSKADVDSWNSLYAGESEVVDACLEWPQAVFEIDKYLDIIDSSRKSIDNIEWRKTMDILYGMLEYNAGIQLLFCFLYLYQKLRTVVKYEDPLCIRVRMLMLMLCSHAEIQFLE